MLKQPPLKLIQCNSIDCLQVCLNNANAHPLADVADIIFRHQRLQSKAKVLSFCQHFTLNAHDIKKIGMIDYQTCGPSKVAPFFNFMLIGQNQTNMHFNYYIISFEFYFTLTLTLRIQNLQTVKISYSPLSLSSRLHASFISTFIHTQIQAHTPAHTHLHPYHLALPSTHSSSHHCCLWDRAILKQCAYKTISCPVKIERTKQQQQNKQAQLLTNEKHTHTKNNIKTITLHKVTYNISC